MSATLRDQRFLKKLGHLFVLLLVFATPPGGSISSASEGLSPRLQIGASLLPAIIAANQSLAQRGSTVPLPLYLLYRDDRRTAEALVSSFSQLTVIRNHAIRIEVISLDELLAAEPSPMSTVFVAEPLGLRLDELTAFAESRRVLTFSPFKGDVERGIATGFRVTDKVLPQVNLGALKRSNIKLKAFFLRIAVKHE